MADDIDKDEATEGEEDTQDEESEESDGEQTSEEETKEDEEKDKGKSRRSVLAQKKHWREKAQQSQSKVKELETELETLKNAVKKPTDDKERAAQEYIRNQARAVYEELQKEREKEETKELAAFEEEVDSVLEDNPDVSEEELLDTIEELEVEPKVALRILKREGKTKEKPKMPKSKRASTAPPSKAPDDSKKNLWEITREEIDRLKS